LIDPLCENHNKRKSRLPMPAYLYDELRIANTHGWKEGKDVEVTIRLV